MTFDDIPLIDFEREVFAECGAWKNFHDLEDSLSLDELIELYEASMERQNRMMRMIAAAMGADVGEEPERKRRGNDSEEDEILLPAYAIDPSKGGRARPLKTKEDVLSLPINLGYNIIEK